MPKIAAVSLDPLKQFSLWNNCLTILTLLGLLCLAAKNFSADAKIVATIDLAPRYVLNSPSCRILDPNPFDTSRKPFVRQKEFGKCTKKHLLTTVNHLPNGSFAISINKLVTQEYHSPARTNLTCCYEVITRGWNATHPDDAFTKSKCMEIEGVTILDKSVEYILVTCKASSLTLNFSKVVYKDAHAIVPVKADVNVRLDEFRSKRAENKMEAPPSVLMLVIDSVSRLNFRRVMPRTLQHLQATGWVELHAYNKIGDVTYPNVMALLEGYNSSESFRFCQPAELGGLDNCLTTWRKFQNNGYVTAYIEDAFYLHTFNYRKKGFLKQPTDYYSRPYFKAMESYLSVKLRSNLKYCLGSVTAPERTMNYMTDFTTTFKNDPFFGIFWINTLCHNTLDMPPSMDVKIKETFEELSNRGVLDDSIVFFFSDHGIRLPLAKNIPTVESEFRLPFMFVWIPEKFRASHPQLFQNLEENSKKLTTPYDIHMTLQHILSLSRNHTERPSRGCPNCTSILKPIPFDRSCAEAGVNVLWCACEMYEPLSVDDATVKAVAQFVIRHINGNILKMTNLRNSLKLKEILYASVNKNQATLPQSKNTSKVLVYHVKLATLPYAKFESAVTVDENNTFEIQGSVSREE